MQWCPSDSTGYVHRRLSGLGLQGPLPGNLSSAAALSVLDAGGNMLTGQLPDRWGARDAMQALTFVNLTGNDITGEAPAVIQGMAQGLGQHKHCLISLHILTSDG